MEKLREGDREIMEGHGAAIVRGRPTEPDRAHGYPYSYKCTHKPGQLLMLCRAVARTTRQRQPALLSPTP